MPNLIEIVWSLYGCYRIALRDNNALVYFNLSASGFWSSFGTILLYVPILFVTGLIAHTANNSSIDFSSYIFTSYLISVLSWLSFLGLVAFLDSRVFKTRKSGTFAIVYNWSQLAVSILWLPFLVLFLGLMGPQATTLFFLIYLGLSYVFLWFVITETLKISGGIAGLLAFSEFMITTIIKALIL